VTGAHAALACAECHGPGDVTPHGDPTSPVNRRGVAATCGRCHASQHDAWAGGAHGRGVEAGDANAPTCVSCHGGHDILRARDDGAPTSAGRVELTCSNCHEDPAVLRHTNLPYAPVEGFEATFHGMALEHGITDVANCASCHGAHAVLPASDPRSRVNPANLRQTCGACHQDLTEEMIAAARHSGGPVGGGGILGALKLYFPIAGVAVNPFLISGMGALVGFLSGLFGVGGGFLMTPLLIFIGIPAAVAAATDAAQITAGATSGALSHSRLGNVDFRMGLVIVAGGWTGGVVGVQLVKVLRNLGNFDFFLKLVYVLVLGFIGITMFLEGLRAWRGRGGAGEPKTGRVSTFFARLPLQMNFPKCGLRTSALLPFLAGLLVGILAAFLGVGGGFIMLPTMIYIIGIPTRVAVGTDLFQIVLTSANVTLQQAITNHTVDVMLAVTLFLGSVIGAQFGVMASRRLRGEQIRVFLALIVMVVMAILLFQLLVPPEHLIDFAKSGGGH
ncbi:MAG: TSUP family transporter, partial [Acidobacteriota bacterium]